MYEHLFKRLIDLIVGILIVPIAVLIIVVFGPVIWLTDKGTWFYNAERLGKDGQIFLMYKLRTMKMNAPDIRNEDGSTYNSIKDPRVTTIGRFLRRTSLDEFPQIFNVLKGDMSLVGPRPDTPDYIDMYTDKEHTKLKCRPGITGYSQVYFRNSIDDHEKFVYDVMYVNDITFLNDMKILFHTVYVVATMKNIYTNDSDGTNKKRSNMKKITIVTSYYYPEITAGTQLYKNMAEDFTTYGAEIRVITNKAVRGISKNVIDDYADKTLESPLCNLTIERVGLSVGEGNSFFIRGLRYFINTLYLFRAAKRSKADCYLIISTPPFLGHFGAILGRRNDVVFNLQDVFPLSMVNAGKMKSSSFLYKFFRLLEKKNYKRFNHIITITDDFKKHVADSGYDDKKISTIYNWIDEAYLREVDRKDNMLIDRYALDPSKFYVTYCGNIGYSQNLELLVDIAVDLEQDDTYKDIEFIIIGDGGWKDNIKTYIDKKQVNSVKMLPYQPYEDLLHVFSLGDVSMVCSKANVGKSSFPSKTWGIMSTSTMVISSFDKDSELCHIIESADCGVCVAPEDTKALRDAIVNAYLNPDEVKDYGVNGRRYIEQNLTRKHATKQYYETIQDVMNNNI